MGANQNVFDEKSIFQSECYDYKGFSVTTIVASSNSLDGSLGTAHRSRSEGEYHILINSVLMEPQYDRAREFVWYHECGHHSLGHLYKRNVSWSARVTRQREADCFAVKMFLTKHSHEEFNLALRQLQGLERGNPSNTRYARIRACKGK